MSTVTITIHVDETSFSPQSVVQHVTVSSHGEIAAQTASAIVFDFQWTGASDKAFTGFKLDGVLCAPGSITGTPFTYTQGALNPNSTTFDSFTLRDDNPHDSPGEWSYTICYNDKTFNGSSPCEDPKSLRVFGTVLPAIDPKIHNEGADPPKS